MNRPLHHQHHASAASLLPSWSLPLPLVSSTTTPTTPSPQRARRRRTVNKNELLSSLSGTSCGNATTQPWLDHHGHRIGKLNLMTATPRQKRRTYTVGDIHKQQPQHEDDDNNMTPTPRRASKRIVRLPNRTSASSSFATDFVMPYDNDSPTKQTNNDKIEDLFAVRTKKDPWDDKASSIHSSTSSASSSSSSSSSSNYHQHHQHHHGPPPKLRSGITQRRRLQLREDEDNNIAVSKSKSKSSKPKSSKSQSSKSQSSKSKSSKSQSSNSKSSKSQSNHSSSSNHQSSSGPETPRRQRLTLTPRRQRKRRDRSRGRVHL